MMLNLKFSPSVVAEVQARLQGLAFSSLLHNEAHNQHPSNLLPLEPTIRFAVKINDCIGKEQHFMKLICTVRFWKTFKKDSPQI